MLDMNQTCEQTYMGDAQNSETRMSENCLKLEHLCTDRSLNLRESLQNFLS